jgi:hypothetical protein
MPRVFTVYNCGTGFDRTHTDELIAHLATITVGAENRDWMINDGPGPARAKFDPKKATLQEAALHASAKVPGSHGAVRTTQHGHTAQLGGHRKGRWFLPKLQGVITGFGWEHNVDHAMDVIMALRQGSTQPPEVINMAGWSRGAITCIMLAHALYAEPETRNLPVNIFAVDPVPGPGNRSDIDKTTLPPNVRRYLGIMAQHEARGLFKPTIIRNSSFPLFDIKDKVLTMPGVHNTGVMFLKTDVGLITASLAHHFLLKHGTQLQDPILLSSRDYCELYARVRMKFKKYSKMSFNMQRILGTHKRKELAFKVPGAATADYFINEHHLKVFGELFPINRNWLLGHPIHMAQVQREQAVMQRQAPTVYQSLEQLGVI